MNYRTYKLRLYIIRLIPPLLLDILRYISRSFLNNSEFHEYIERKNSDVINFKQIYYLTSNAILNIPIENIRHHGGQAYNYNQHHFMKYYKEGINELKDYYDNHCPKTIFEKHFIFNTSFQQASLPWVVGSNVNKSGEHGLSTDHGNSAYGPISEEKLKLEAKRLDKCLKSIEKNGYLEYDKFTKAYNGFPRGYFLVSNEGKWVFRVVGAKHRVAALAHLGWKNIPVCLEPTFPNCILEKDISEWPGVASGEFNEYEAKLIFDSYFKDREIRL